MNEPMNAKALIDPFGRKITYLRMSVTDRCNFRCTYCMPEEGLKVLGRYHLLSFEELAQIARVFVAEGIRKIRLTGGEPLLRQDIHLLVRKISVLHELKDLCLTTNGHLLAQKIGSLVDAGLRRINVSLDSLDPKKFEKITRGGQLHRVLCGLEQAVQMLPGPTKINVVVCRNFNDDEILDFARLSIDPGYHIRFIEQMPMSSLAAWTRGEVLSVIDIRREIEESFGLEAITENDPHSGPASRFRIPGARGEIGFIGAVTNEFCARCNRLRLTPDGKLRGCLMKDGEVDLLHSLRNGGGDDSLRALLHDVMRSKPERHQINDSYFIRPDRTMSQIGG
jgi:cyclic pyranopterin phosphate synthase